SRDGTPEGSQPAFAVRGCRPWGTHPLSVRLPSGLGFLPHPTPAVSSAFFAVSLPSRGDNGVTSFTFSIDRGFSSCLWPGGARSSEGDRRAPVPDHVPFWFKPGSILGLSKMTAFSSTSPGLPFPRTAGPRPP